MKAKKEPFSLSECTVILDGLIHGLKEDKSHRYEGEIKIFSCILSYLKVLKKLMK